MRKLEKFIQQVILAGMRKNSTGTKFDEYCARVEDVVNKDILGRTTPNAKNGQWRVPLDKKDVKKLGDVKLSGHSSTKFLAGLTHLFVVFVILPSPGRIGACPMRTLAAVDGRAAALPRSLP